MSPSYVLRLRENTLDLDFEGVDGLKPDPEKHQFHMLVQVLVTSNLHYK